MKIRIPLNRMRQVRDIFIGILLFPLVNDILHTLEKQRELDLNE